MVIQKILRIVFLVVLVSLTSTTKAQILNVNKHDVTTDSANYWMGWLNFFFQIDNRSPTPNEEASLLALESSLDIIYVSERNAHFLSGQLNHYQATGDPVISTGFAHYRINFDRKKDLSIELYVQCSFDYSRFLDLRALGGGGLKYRLINSDVVELDIGSGVLYEHEKWGNLADDGTYTVNKMTKSSNYVKSNIGLSDHVNLAFIAFYQFGYDRDIKQVRQRISSQLQLAFTISKHFGFIVEGAIYYENKPVIPINKTIYSFQNGLRYQF
ncbi:DUF481 domain-containing protein [Reichenbachiella sp.]|uniref:DUF481 domain-containing protein n=1 Tax=Reichenbachiella sp. TaxID=2184521 RepID=UPI003B595421